MDREKEKTKTELLSELESIQGLLLDDIPLLNEVINKTEAGVKLNKSAKPHVLHSAPSLQGSEEENYELDLGSAPSDGSENNLTMESQQALFSLHGYDADIPQSKTNAQTTTIKAVGENPFLPQHIRERLKGNRAAEFAPNATDPIDSQSALIEELINSVMPQLEAQLRLKLTNMTDEQLQQLLQSR